jgi:hypothetical protein
MTPAARKLRAFVVAATFVATASSILCDFAVAQVQVDFISSGAVSPGGTTELLLRGKRLNESLKFWSGFPATFEVLPPDGMPVDETRKVKVTVPANAAVGVYGLVTVGLDSGSATEPWLMMVDDLGSITEVGTNKSVATAQELTLPIALDGSSDGPTSDFYRFTGKQGQRVAIEMVASRLGADLDLILTVFDPAGNEIASVDDDLLTRGDPRVALTLQTEGVYTIEVRDSRYRAGRYRLRVGDFPLVQSVYPLAAHEGQGQLFALATDVTTAPILASKLLPVHAGQSTPVSAKLPGGVSSGWTNVRASNLTEILEGTFAADADSPTPAVVPAAFNGRFETAGDVDVFEFPMNKGERVYFRGLGRSYGSPAIPLLRVLNAAGGKLAESAVPENDEDLALEFAAPDTGTYRLQASELLGRGGGAFVYRIESSPAPGFALIFKNEGPNNKTLHTFGAGDGAWTIDVVSARRGGYNGPIALSIESDRPGWRIFNEVIKEGQNETKMHVVAPADLAKGEYVEFRIVGKAKVGDVEVSAIASNAVQIKAARPQWAALPGWLEGRIAAVGVGNQTKLYTAKPTVAEFLFAKQGIGKAVIQFDRVEPNFKDVPLTLIATALPPGLSISAITRVSPGTSEKYDVMLAGAENLPDGKHRLAFWAYSQNGAIGQAMPVEAVVTVGSPLSVKLDAGGVLAAGAKRQLKVTVARAGEDAQPVVVKLKKLPAGVTTAESVTIAADQTEATFELTAAPDAPAAKLEDLSVTATSTYIGKPVTVDSPNSTIEVTAKPQ